MRFRVLSILLAGSMLSIGTAQAQAQKQKPFSWTGVYLGVHGGLAMPSATYSLAGASAVINSTGFSGGGQIGFNVQWDAMVLGLEADVGLNTARRDYNNILLAGDLLRGTMPTLATFRARAGYALDRVLIYATGGLSLGNPTLSYTVGALSATSTTTKVGWTLGAGVEYAMTDNWTMKLEYGYLNIANEANSLIAGDRVVYDAHSIKLGINYLFR